MKRLDETCPTCGQEEKTICDVCKVKNFDSLVGFCGAVIAKRAVYQKAIVEAYARLDSWCDLWKEKGGSNNPEHLVFRTRDILAAALGKETA